MDTKRLQIFVSAAETLNFSEVAKKFYFSQSTISHQIGLLEEELGVLLFSRVGKKVFLTEEGQFFYHKALTLLDQFSTVLSDVTDFSHRNDHLDILCSEAGYVWYKKYINGFLKEYPDVLINIHNINPGEILTTFFQDTYDIVFTYREMLASSTGYEYLSLAPDTLCLVTSMEHPVLTDLTDLSSLKDLPFLPLRASQSNFMQQSIDFLFTQRGFEYFSTHTFNRLDSILFAVKSGHGYTVVPASVLENSQGEVRIYPLEDSSNSKQIAIGWKRGQNNPAIKHFVDYVKQNAG